MKEKSMKRRTILAVVLGIIAIVSFTVISDYATSPDVHSSTIAVLDEKKTTAMELTAAVAVTSTAISAIPGDAATPIANQVSELTTPLLIVICAIYLEKFLLTTIGYISFKFLIPIACVMFGIYLYYPREVLKAFAKKILIFAMAVFLIIPASVKVMNLIDTTFEESISRTFNTVDDISEEAKDSSEEEDTNAFQEFLTSIGDEVASLKENAKNALSVFVDAIAVLIITTCVIPIAVILFFIWIVKALFGVPIHVPNLRNDLVKGKQ